MAQNFNWQLTFVTPHQDPLGRHSLFSRSKYEKATVSFQFSSRRLAMCSTHSCVNASISQGQNERETRGKRYCFAVLPAIARARYENVSQGACLGSGYICYRFRYYICHSKKDGGHGCLSLLYLSQSSFCHKDSWVYEVQQTYWYLRNDLTVCWSSLRIFYHRLEPEKPLLNQVWAFHKFRKEGWHTLGVMLRG